jgi:hypothetical protein
MRLRLNDARERRIEHLQEAVEEKTKSKALDQAAEFTIDMLGGTTARPTGAFEELLEAAEEEGSLTASEIAEVLDSRTVPVEYESKWSVGED